MELGIMSMVPSLRTPLGRLVILILLVCELSGSVGLPFSDLDVLSLIDPIEQFEEESEAKKVFVKSVFNVPVKEEPTVEPCPQGTRRVTQEGPCESMVSGIKLDDQFILDSFSHYNFNRRRPLYPNSNKRRRTTTPRYEPVPTYIISEEKTISSGGRGSVPLNPIYNRRPPVPQIGTKDQNSYAMPIMPSTEIKMESTPLQNVTQESITSLPSFQIQSNKTQKNTTAIKIYVEATTTPNIQSNIDLIPSNDVTSTLGSSTSISTFGSTSSTPSTPSSNTTEAYTRSTQRRSNESEVTYDTTLSTYDEYDDSSTQSMYQQEVINELTTPNKMFEELSTHPLSNEGEVLTRDIEFTLTSTSPSFQTSMITFPDESSLIDLRNDNDFIVFSTDDEIKMTTLPSTQSESKSPN